tara:strand:- start:1558 stop:2313 length:756 start_codon:yes stop_codon:yes gene_type:complete
MSEGTREMGEMLASASLDINGEIIAKAALEMGAIQLNPEKPFEWASGYRMPIYNNNRLFLSYPEYRALVKESFREILELEGIDHDIIAGTVTAGIPWAALLADSFEQPMIYVRDEPKSHGLKTQIEGIDKGSDLGNSRVVLIEDLISTGGSSARVVQAIRDANGNCVYCLSIFDYGLDMSKEIFGGEKPYDREGHKLEWPCEVRSLLNYHTLLEVAKSEGHIDDQQSEMLEEWRRDPFAWGENHGFPRVER